MDVIVPYGINYKKCGILSLSGYKKTQIIPFLKKNILEKKSETVMALVAEMHCSSFYTDIENFIINFYSEHLSVSALTYSFFIARYLQKISQIKENIKKINQNISLINSNEMRNIYCSIFSNFLENKHNRFLIKIENKCYLDEVYLLHSNIKSYSDVYDDNNVKLSDKLSRGLREILYWIDNPKINYETTEKILYWIHWCMKIESLEKKIYSGINLCFNSDYPILDQIKNTNGWEYFLWTKIWHANYKNNYMNKNLLKSLTKLFFHNYKRGKLKDRTGILAMAINVCNLSYKLKIERKISKMEIFASLNANLFYKNINIDENNDEKYLEAYNSLNNIKTIENTKKIYKINSLEKKMDFLREYIPKETIILPPVEVKQENKNETDNTPKNIKKVTEYFSS